MTNIVDTAESRDRARGALLGLAVGDAVGTTLEFAAPGTFEPITDLVGGGPFGLAAGEWTDDTSMALCLAESLLDRGGHDPVDQLRRYVLWWREGYLSSNGRCFDIGNTTRRQLARFERTGDPEDPTVDEEHAANGSLMRLAPVAIRSFRDPEVVVEMAAASSRATHPARRPVDACRLLAAMIGALIRGEPAEAVFAPDFWNGGELHPEIAAIAHGSWQTKQPPQIRGTGYCVDALEAAIWSVAGADDFADAVLRAANLGDDADTTAAIAGQLAGARWGAAAIRHDWLDRLVLRDRITSLADGLWCAATNGTSPWPFDHVLHAWWAAPGLLAGEYPGAPAPIRAQEKIGILLDAGIRTFVDLTTPADRLTPYAPILDAAKVARGLAVERIEMPIPDLFVIDDHHYVELVRRIANEIAASRPVFVHCWGGVGRTGTVIGAWHVTHGLSVEQALTAIAEARQGTRKAVRSCPETDAQLATIRRLAG